MSWYSCSGSLNVVPIPFFQNTLQIFISRHQYKLFIPLNLHQKFLYTQNHHMIFKIENSLLPRKRKMTADPLLLGRFSVHKR